MKYETGERRSLWHNYFSIAVLHTILAVSQAEVFHGPIPYNILESKLVIRQPQAPIPTSQTSQDVLDQTQMFYHDCRRNAMQAYIKHKAHYDKKANASKLKKADYVNVLQLKAVHQGSKIPFMEFRWIGHYITGKVLPNNKYLVREIGTNKTQVFQRMRIRQLTARQPYLIYESHHKNGHLIRT